MPAAVDLKLIDILLLGQDERRRQLQDFPVLGDVWSEFALDPAGRRDLLITPHRDHSSARVAAYLEEHVDPEGSMISTESLQSIWICGTSGASSFPRRSGGTGRSARCYTTSAPRRRCSMG